MAGTTLLPSLIVGGFLGRQWNHKIDSTAINGEGFVFGALWMASATIISRCSCQLQESIAKPTIWKFRALAISSLILALLSGLICRIVLNKKLGFSIPVKTCEGITVSMIFLGKYSIQFFSFQKLW